MSDASAQQRSRQQVERSPYLIESLHFLNYGDATEIGLIDWLRDW